MSDTQPRTSDTNAQEAVEFLRLVSEAESRTRMEQLEDMKFRYGEQWPLQIMQSRQLEGRPCLTINEVDAYIRQVTNLMRQQRPRIKVHPVNNTADVKIAQVLQGICRHIEVNSDADYAYDLAADYAVTMGVGYFRIMSDYIREDSFDQDLFIRHIENPFSVYADPNSNSPDGSDYERCLITDKIRKEDFRRIYPGADEQNFIERTAGDVTAEWVTQEDIRLAEYFYVERIKDKVLAIAGPAGQMTMLASDYERNRDLMTLARFNVNGDRPTYRKIVRWCKVSAVETLEDGIWPGRYIPVVPVYGTTVMLDGRRRRFGMVRMGRDPQMMANFWKTAATESIALAPKAKWQVAEGQDEGFENEYAQANVSARPVIHYKTSDAAGNPVGPPVRVQPEPPPAGILEAMQSSSLDLQRVMGIFDPAMGVPSGPKSGKAINAEKMQSEQSNFHFYDHQTRSIRQGGRIILDAAPKIYDRERVMRIIGEDGKPDLVTINEQKMVEGVTQVLNNVTIGTYDVVMDTGPGFNTKRLESVELLTPILAGNKELFGQIGDIWFRNQDFSGADVIADRLAAANPLSKIDENSPIPPQAQMQLNAQQQQIQGLQQQLAQVSSELKTKQEIERGWQDVEMRKAFLVHETKTHDTMMSAATKRHDTELRGLAAQNVEELKGAVAIINKHLEGLQAEREFERQAAQVDMTLAAKSAQEESLNAGLPQQQ